MFSLSYSETYELENGSLENGGLVGVRGMSSDISEALVVVLEVLVGVLIYDDAGDRVGVIGSNVKC